jgi:hypothetical protein
MNNMFSIDDLFSQMFPWLSGISWDLGTILTSIVFLWFLLLGFDWVKAMFGLRIDRHFEGKHADYYFEQAESARSSRDTHAEGSIHYEEQNLIYKNFLNKSVNSRIKGWR